MSEIIYTETFVEGMSKIYPGKVQDGILSTIELLPFVPVLGSTDVPESITKEFGSEVRKIVVTPFLVLYKVVGNGDFLILGIMPERAAF